MNVDHIANTPDERLMGTPENMQLRNACRDMEGVFLSMLMKAGLKGMIENEEDSSRASSLLEATLEQMANQMAQSESMGISKMIYEQVTGMNGPVERKTP